MSNEIKTIDTSEIAIMERQFALLQRQAIAFSGSTLVPKEYQGNVSNCLIALEVAARTNANPLMVAQNLYIVHGRPSWSSQFVIAAINSCGRFKPLRFEFEGKENSDDWSCTAWTVEKDIELPKNIRTLSQAIENDIPVLKSSKISIKMAKAEGWYGKNGSKWQTLPEQMLQYRAASFFGRIYAPDILMGMRTDDEVRDMIDVTPQSQSEVIDQPKSEPKSALDAFAGESTIKENLTVEISDVAENATSEKEIDITPLLSTQTKTKELATALLKAIETAPQEERAAIFVKGRGDLILDALSQHGLGLMKQKFTALGIYLPDAA